RHADANGNDARPARPPCPQLEWPARRRGRRRLEPSPALERFGRRLLTGVVAGWVEDRLLLAGLHPERNLPRQGRCLGPRRGRRRWLEPAGPPLGPGRPRL